MKTVSLFYYLIKKDKNGQIKSIYSPLSKRDLRKEILCLPEEQQYILVAQLQLPEASPEDIEAFRKLQSQRETDRALLERIMALDPGYETDNKTVVEQILVRGII